jgi:hypothetical protein
MGYPVNRGEEINSFIILMAGPVEIFQNTGEVSLAHTIMSAL